MEIHQHCPHGCDSHALIEGDEVRWALADAQDWADTHPCPLRPKTAPACITVTCNSDLVKLEALVAELGKQMLRMA